MDNEPKQDEIRRNYKMKKRLVLYPFNQKFPVVYDSTIELFYKNYDVNYSPPKRANLYWLKDNKIIRNSYYFVIKIIRKYLKLNSAEKKLSINPERSLLYCFNQLPPPEFDFILDLETVIGLADYKYLNLNEKYKKYISDRLASEKCKAITCWNKLAYLDLIQIIDCSRFKKKINIIPFAGKNLELQKRDKKSLNFLFVASINNPVAFETKGGLIALETFARLSRKYKEIKYFVRANVSKKLIKKYKNIPRLIFLRKYLSDENMKELFSNSYILLEPLPGMDLMFKCMESGIPVIGFDYECTLETIINNKTGFFIDNTRIFGDRDNLDKYYRNQNENYKKLSKREEYMKFVPEFVEKCEILIKDRKLLNKMTKEQHSLIEDRGKFSLKKRNQKLINLINPHIK